MTHKTDLTPLRGTPKGQTPINITYYPPCTTLHVLPSMYYPPHTTLHVLPSTCIVNNEKASGSFEWERNK